MAVDWNRVSQAIRIGKTGGAAEALQTLTSTESDCESEGDRAAVCLAQAMCLAYIGNLSQAFARIEKAKQLTVTRGPLMLQVELAEAATRLLNAEYQTACDLYERIAASYADLLAEDADSAQEFDERLGYALVHVQRYADAIPIFQRLLRSSRLEDEQRVRLYLGAALAASGQVAMAQCELQLAAKGPDEKLSKDALERLSTLREIH